MPAFCAISLILLGRPDQDRRDEAFLASLDRACERRLLAGVRNRRRHRREAPASFEHLFVLSSSG